MADIYTLFPPPQEVQDKAWRRGYSLITTWRQCVPRDQFERIAWAVARGPHMITFQNIADINRLWGQIVLS